jgi:hypothetical protein
MVPLLRDLVEVNIKTLRQLDQGFLTRGRGNRNLCLECWAVTAPRPSRHSHLLAHGNHADVARKNYIYQMFRFIEPPLSR